MFLIFITASAIFSKVDVRRIDESSELGVHVEPEELNSLHLKWHEACVYLIQKLRLPI